PGDRLKKYDRIIVIAVESLDLDYIHAFNHAMPADATPYLDSLAAQYPVFRNYFSGAQPTSYAFTSMILSRMDFDDDLRLGSISLNDELRKLGWKSVYISPTNGKLFDNKRDYAAVFWFDEMYFLEDLGRKAETKWGLTDATLFECAAGILEAETAEKSITFISTMDLHNPYMRSGPAKDHPESVPFLASLRCTDANLRQFITRIQQNEKLWNGRTLLLLTADHSATHGANYTGRNDFTPARIPLFVLTKDPVRDLPLDKYCSSLDLPATILHQLGQEIPQTFMGQDIFTKKSFALTWSSLDRNLYLKKPEQTIVNTPALKAFYALFYGQD
ncbi:MAG: sulfatase-like hydrolase/transferase, partial [Lentisphaeria bacterium]|nr:sulfatase-like hydrolase/transferase [Lentisphaeria bacterium]